MVTTALRERMRAILRARNYSPRTIQTYIAAVRHFARHFGTPPDQLGAEHVITYQVWLRDQKRASHVLFNQIVCALRFFYSEALDRPDVVERIRYARRERRLPVVLSIEETIALLASIDHPRYRVLLTTIYATGLRLLPPRLVRIRYYGFLANRSRARSIDLARRLIGGQPLSPVPPSSRDEHLGPHCGTGTLRLVGPVPAERPPPHEDSL
jgi:site-specific recombinase XerD